MIYNEKNGGAAFPSQPVMEMSQSHFAQPIYHRADGMSLRDYFAGNALIGLCANDRWNATNQVESVVRSAYELADAMLAERAKQ